MRLAARFRTGFTLVEVLVAIVLLAFGVTVLEAVAAVTIRALAESRRVERGAAMVEHRVALAAALCVAAAGTDSSDGVTLAWAATPSGGGVSVTATMRTGSAAHSHVDTFTTARGCP